MTLEKILEACEALIKEQLIIEDDYFGYYLFYKLFNKIPYVDYFLDDEDEDEDPEDTLMMHSVFDPDEDMFNETFNYRKTVNKLIKSCPNAVVYNYKSSKMVVTDEFIVFRGLIYHLNPEVPKICTDSVVIEKNGFGALIYVSIDSKGRINRNFMPIKEAEVNLEENYNDDLPYEKIEEAITADAKSTIMLLFGAPGTGKTYLLRKLIHEHQELNFFWLDSSMFNRIDSTEFSQFLLKCKNAIFILEDCELVIRNREDSYNTLITPLLQLTDGLIGDNLGLKFICTFNTDLKNVDPALQRKGRCSLSYEFKKLSKEKVQALWDKLGIDKTATEDLPLCDVLNTQVENGVEKQRKIGF